MIRKATIKDVNAIYTLLNLYSQKGELLARPLSRLYDHLRDFSVYQVPSTGQVVGCCALQICWEDLVEIRSLAVHPDYTGNKIGTNLALTVLKEARAFNISRIFTLTYRPGFFKQLGFIKIDRSQLPIKIWADCLACVKFPNCDEIAMLKKL